MRTRIHVAALLALASTASCDIFTPSITTASSTYTDCAAALGTNYFECSPPSGSQPRLLCFNPSAGETCCESLWTCPPGASCLSEGRCCPSGTDPQTCASPAHTNQLSTGAIAGIAAGAGAAVLAMLGAICYKYVHARVSAPTAPLLPTVKGAGAKGASQQLKRPPPQKQQLLPPDQSPQQQQHQSLQPDQTDQGQTQQDQGPIDHPEHPHRFPRFTNPKVDKHHHHVHTGFHQPCLADHCELNSSDHRCHPREADTCACTCRDENCLVTKERREERLRRDVVGSVVLSAL